MKRYLQAGLAALGLRSKSAETSRLTPAEFTAQFVARLNKVAPQLKPEVIKDLELKMAAADGGSSTAFLHNAYETYQANPGALNHVLEKFTAAAAETVSITSKGLDRTRIIPVVKDRAWIEDTHRELKNRGSEKLPENVYEDLNSELIVVYAEDSPHNIRYFSPKDLEEAGVNRSELRPLACANLKKLIPAPQRQGGEGIFMITAGGDYESSLLLYDKIWEGMKADVKGEVIVCIPTRDVLLVTGSEDLGGLAKIKKFSQEIFSKSSYRLTTCLFVYRSGLFDVFEA